MEEVLLAILGGDEPEAPVADDLLYGSVRHRLETSCPSLDLGHEPHASAEKDLGSRRPFAPVGEANAKTLANRFRVPPAEKRGWIPEVVASAFMTARVVCLSPFSEDAVRGLIDPRHPVAMILVPDPPAQEAVLEATHLAHLVIADQRHKHRIDRRVLENMRNCQLIQAASVGFDTVDHRAAAELGIPVANCAGYNREAVADWTMLAILALLRRGAWADRQMRTDWWSQQELLGHQLGALTVGIVGLGNVGGTVARRLTGFGSRVIYADPDPSREFPGAERLALDELLASADVVTVHVPLDVETRGLIGREAFA